MNNNEIKVDAYKSLKTVRKAHLIMLIILICASPFIIMFTPGNKAMVAAVLALLAVMTLRRYVIFNKDFDNVPLTKKLLFIGFDFTGKHIFFDENSKKIKIIFIPIELQNAFQKQELYEITYLPVSKIFDKVLRDSSKSELKNK